MRKALLLTCGRMPSDDLMKGIITKTLKPPSKSAPHRGKMIYVSYYQAVAWSFSLESCSTWFVSKMAPARTITSSVVVYYFLFCLFFSFISSGFWILFDLPAYSSISLGIYKIVPCFRAAPFAILPPRRNYYGKGLASYLEQSQVLEYSNNFGFASWVRN